MVFPQTMEPAYYIAARHIVAMFFEIGITVANVAIDANLGSVAVVEFVPMLFTMLIIVESVTNNAHRELSVSLVIVVMLRFILI